MTAPKLHTHRVTDDDNGIRLDRWFKRHFPALTHGQLQKLLRTGQVRVEGKRVEASHRLEAGQNIRVPPTANETPHDPAAPKIPHGAEQLKKYVLFEDDDVIVLNKPAGLAVQGGSGLKENIDDMLEIFTHRKHGKPKLVHRLDRDTSGVLLIARSTSAAAKLSESFRARSTQKIYWGITLGVPSPIRGRIEVPLVKKGERMVAATEEELQEEQRRLRAAKKTGKRDTKSGDEKIKSATTVYQIMESAKGQAAFVAMWPITGRTHQLRVHMATLGTPLLGDRLYCDQDSAALPMDELGQGLHLHARRLIIPHPKRGIIDATAPLSMDLRKTWSWFGFDRDANADFSEA